MIVTIQALLALDQKNSLVDGFRMEYDLVTKGWSVGFTESTDADCSDPHFQYDYEGPWRGRPGLGPCKARTLPEALALFAQKVSDKYAM